MGLITRTTYVDGTAIDAATQNTNENNILNEFNGNIENANVKATAAIGGTKCNLTSVGAIGSTSPSTGAFTTLTTTGNLTIGGSNKELRFSEGANYVGFEASALAADQIWVLPYTDGSAEQVMKTDGSGGLYWRDPGRSVQITHSSTGDYSANGATIPHDDSIPQLSEGSIQLTHNHTPKKATNYLRVDVNFMCGASVADYGALALFVDNNADASAVAVSYLETTTANPLCLTYYTTAKKATVIKYKVSCGVSTNTVYVNGGGGARLFGGALSSTITVTEYEN